MLSNSASQTKTNCALFFLPDVYVFGIGATVNKNELNSLASKKRGETHFFVLKDYEKLGEVFNSIISEEQLNSLTKSNHLSHSNLKFTFKEK